MSVQLICRHTKDEAGSWLLCSRLPTKAWRVEGTTSLLEPMVRTVLDGSLLGDLTFSTRAFADMVEAYAENPEDLPKLGRNSMATILCPEGRREAEHDRWATLSRIPMTGAVVVAGPEGMFRPQVLKERLMRWFTEQQFRSFAPPNPGERFEQVDRQPQRPPYIRELLVRPRWTARTIVPEAFASREELAAREAKRAAAQAELAERMEAKNPRLRQQRRQADAVREEQAKRQGGATWVAYQNEKKAAHGGTWNGPAGG